MGESWLWNLFIWLCVIPNYLTFSDKILPLFKTYFNISTWCWYWSHCRHRWMSVANAQEFDNSITRGNFLRSGEWMGWVGEKLEQCKDQPKYPISFLSPHKLLSKCRIRRKNVSSLDPNGNNYFNQTQPLFTINWWVTGEEDTFLLTLLSRAKFD